jgi:hypothetical protein
MPDGDWVHSGLRSRYQKPYKILCEGAASSKECARSLLESLRKDLRDYAKLPLLLARDIADRFSQIIGPLEISNQVEWARISSDIEEMAQKVGGPLNAKELMIRAGKSVLNDIRYGREVETNNMQAKIYERFIHEVFESEFKGRIPLSLEHHAGVSHGVLESRVEAMEPYVDSGIQLFARAAIQNQSLERLPLPRRQFRRDIELNENLLAS